MRRLFRYFNLHHDEQQRVALMFGVGFFVGVFLTAYTVAAESLFLSKLGSRLNEAFLYAGLFGILATLIFSWLQNVIKFSWLVTLTVLSIICISAALHYSYHSDLFDHDFILFLLYCFTGPFTALLLLCYWGIFGRLFNFRQSKRIIGWIDTGQLIAIIATNFLIPLLSSVFPVFSDTSNFLFISIGGILIALGLIYVIFYRYTLLKNDPGEFEKSVLNETRFTQIFKDRYVLLLAVFLIISMCTLMFSQYSFQTVINKQYPNQKDLANFLGYFNGTTYMLSMLMQTFVNNKIISNYGIRLTLMFVPAVTGLFAFVAIAAPSGVGFILGDTEAQFLYLFLFIALMRLFNNMLRDSLENPVYKLLFIPLDDRMRFGIQAKVEGVISESGRFIAGLCLFAFSMIPFFEVEWVVMLALVLCVLYIIVSNKLYGGYRHKIRQKLETAGLHDQRLDIGYFHLITRLEKNLAKRQRSSAIFSYRLLEKINPSKVGRWLNYLMRNSVEDTRDFAQGRMNELKSLSVSESYVVKVKPHIEGKKVLNRGELELLFSKGGDITRARIQKLARSPEIRDRQYAAELSLHSSSEESLTFLIELLTDTEEKVRRTAIISAIKKNNGEVIYALIDNLSHATFSNQAMNALILIGEKTLPYLENAFYRTGQLTQTMLRIVQIMGRIRGHRAQELLWNKIDYHDKVIVSQVLSSMGESGFKAGVSQVSRIKHAIESDIADISWNLSALQEVDNSLQTQTLRQALQMEIQNDTEHIYMLLAMLYDTGSIQLVKEIIEGGTSEGTTYAIELLDVFLSDQLKVRVIPVIDDLSATEKINRLEVFYPRVKLDEKLVLKFLINRDFTQTNRWTKACVIHLIGERRIRDFVMDLIAQLFNPDRLVREVAAWALYQINPELYSQNVKRLEEGVRKSLDAVVLPVGRTKGAAQLMLYDKVTFFGKVPIFAEIQGRSLAALADISFEMVIRENEVMVMDDKKTSEFFMIYAGSVQYFEKGEWVTDFREGQLIGEMVASHGFANTHQLVAKTNTNMLRINKDQFYELLADNVKLADKVLDFI